MNRSKIKQDLFVDTDHKLYSKEIMIVKNHRLFINEFEDGDLDGIFNELYDADEYDTLEIRVSSPGGYLFDLQRFHNLIENVFPDRTYTVLDNHGFSAGAFIFCLGTERIAHEFSQIMFHDWSGGYYGKATDIDKQHNFSRPLLKKYMKSILENFLTESELNEMFEGKEFWFDTREMCRRGICTHVMYKGEKKKAEDYIKLTSIPTEAIISKATEKTKEIQKAQKAQQTRKPQKVKR